MEYRSVIFYLALLFIVGSVVELYVRANGVGENIVKLKGVVVPKKPRLAPPMIFLVFSIILAALTFPR
jgi:hypothetical protein